MGDFAAPFALLQPVHVDPSRYAQQYEQLRAMAQARQMRQQEMAANAQVQQINQIKIQDAQRAQQDQQILSEAYHKSGGDLDKTRQMLIDGRASGGAIQGFDAMRIKMRQEIAAMEKGERENTLTRHNQLSGALQAFMEQPEEVQAQKYPAFVEQQLRNGNLTQAELAQTPKTYPGAAQMKVYGHQLFTGLQLLEEGRKDAAEQRAKAEEARKVTEEARKVKADAMQALSAVEYDQKTGMPTEKGMGTYAALREQYPNVLPPTLQPGDIPRMIEGQISPEKRAELELRRQGVEIQRQELLARQQELQSKLDPLGLSAASGAAAAPTAGAGTQASPLAREIASFEGFNKSGSVAQRNNNPGNLRAGPGATGTDPQGYAIFPNVQAGWSALEDLIQKRSGQGLTLQEFIGGKPGVYPGYAPAADKNDPATYAATIGKNLGVPTTTPLASIVGGAPQSGGAVGAFAGLTGDALLKKLPTPIANQIKGMAEGRLAIPSGRVLATPYGQQIVELVAQYDPSFDVNNPGKRMATAKDFASGKSAQQVNALNTVIGHLDSFSQAADRLNNTRFSAYNSLKNWIAAETGDPDVKTFDATKKAVTDELTRVWRGTGGSEQDIKSWGETLDKANSPEQLHGVIAQIGHLLESKLDSLRDQYREGMGTIAQGREMISPGARATLDRLERKTGGGKEPAAGAVTVKLKSGRSVPMPEETANKFRKEHPDLVAQ